MLRLDAARRFHARLAVMAIGCLAGLALPARAQKLEALKPQGYVSDFAGVLDSTSRTSIANLCAEVDQKTGAQIAIVTVRTLNGDPIDDFANRLFERWGNGPKSNNRGVLILVATDDHRYRVEVGYGPEPILPDGKVGGFGRSVVPLFRRGEYGPALMSLTSDVAQVIAADRGVSLANASTSAPATRDDRAANPYLPLIPLLFLLGFGGFALLSPLLFGGRRHRRFGGWGWWGGPWIGGGWGGGFGGGGWGGGGGGFGGFGGGISGGGGASGSW